MFPALQLGYMLVPRPLRERFLAVKWLADRGSISMQQHVLAACISSGQYLRDLRRIAHRLAPRHRALHDALQARLGSAMAVTGSVVAGGSLFVHLPPLPRSATGALMAEALARGVRVRSAERFHRMPPEHVTLVLSYAGLSEASLKRAGARLAEACLAVEKGLVPSPPLPKPGDVCTELLRAALPLPEGLTWHGCVAAPRCVAADTSALLRRRSLMCRTPQPWPSGSTKLCVYMKPKSSGSS